MRSGIGFAGEQTRPVAEGGRKRPCESLGETISWGPLERASWFPSRATWDARAAPEGAPSDGAAQPLVLGAVGLGRDAHALPHIGRCGGGPLRPAPRPRISVEVPRVGHRRA